MPPTTIIDSDLDPFDNTVYFALEAGSIWKAVTLGGGSAAWSEVYTTPAFEADSGCSGAEFTRVRCAKAAGLVYVIGFAQTEEQAGSDMYTAYCFKTTNGGDTWSYFEIKEFENGGPEYYFTGDVDNLNVEAGSMNITFADELTYTCTGTFDGLPNRWHIAEAILPIGGDWEVGYPQTVKVLVTGVIQPTFGFIDSIQWNPVAWDDAVDQGGGEYLYSDLNEFPVTVQNMRIRYAIFGSQNDVWGYTVRILEIDGTPVTPSRDPIGFDVSSSNTSWLYLGLGEEILASEDGGATWFTFQDEHGANDICCDPQLGGAIYYWSTDGDLNLMVKQTLGQPGVITDSGMDTETPTRIPLRLARDPNSGRLWALNGGTALKMRNLGSWSTQKTGLSGARGLHAYLGGKMIFVDAADIYISDDLGETITAKKGGWAYSGGVNSHRIASDE